MGNRELGMVKFDRPPSVSPPASPGNHKALRDRLTDRTAFDRTPAPRVRPRQSVAARFKRHNKSE
ncbi:hypothetical protein [Tychonema sp. LEGE 07203]|uniref:hypothetical protein n=1 Tax=Tychonema sp. LEGE 07203 TaxID=1828671 RepID=UPI001882CD80|nr:hypothetical protein [Tychonema sp. LEGE 07203]MBE9093860.1 hypothetical protein [Tychonema sp. LEGE 07203]